MFSRKNIVLSGVDNSSQKAVLSLEYDGQMAKGKLRLYNFGAEPKGIISLGIFQDGNVVKAGLIKCSQMLYTFACQANEISDEFSCAVINFVNGEPNPILFGKGEGCINKDDIFTKIAAELKSTNSASEVERTLDKYDVDYDKSLKEEIENEIDEYLEEEGESKEECNDCENCIYKKYYLENCKSQELGMINEVLSNSDENNEETSSEFKFYDELKPQIDKLFSKYPTEDYLEKLLPNTKWVKVNLDDSDNYFVLGLIYEQENLKYICYGVPGVFSKNPPRELSGFPIWFPLEESKPQGFGYWLSYQDADSGESVKAIVV